MVFIINDEYVSSHYLSGFAWYVGVVLFHVTMCIDIPDIWNTFIIFFNVSIHVDSVHW